MSTDSCANNWVNKLITAGPQTRRLNSYSNHCLCFPSICIPHLLWLREAKSPYLPPPVCLVYMHRTPLQQVPRHECRGGGGVDGGGRRGGWREGWRHARECAGDDIAVGTLNRSKLWKERKDKWKRALNCFCFAMRYRMARLLQKSTSWGIGVGVGLGLVGMARETVVCQRTEGITVEPDAQTYPLFSPQPWKTWPPGLESPSC